MRSLQFLTACLVLLLVCWLSIMPVAYAAETSSARVEALFTLECAGCHPNGGNIIRRGKTLKQKALQRYGVDSVEAIAALIANGKGVMSAFRERLTPAEIEQLAQYVLEKSTQW